MHKFGRLVYASISSLSHH
ncbi:DUF2633 family protein [Maribacter sp. RZ05]|uniref:DUF2633 family protein n=1 Tax=Maribacter luteus TaxID=2594478 RepID=A0A6I2MR17_9FLAO|nr:DUF2633 family protein [Maribacter luteus]